MTTLFNIELFDSLNRQTAKHVDLIESTANLIIKRDTPALGSSYKYRSDACSNTAAVKVDRKQNDTRVLRFNDTGDLVFPKYRTSKVNLQAKQRGFNSGETFYERKAKQIRAYYLDLICVSDQVIHVHVYRDSKKQNADIRRCLMDLSIEYPDQFITIELDNDGFIIPENEPKEYPILKGIQPGRVNEYIKDLAADLEPLIKSIISDRNPTTKYNYGRYLDLLTRLCKGPRDPMLPIVTAAMLECGANADGLAAAYKIYKG